jgi:hypothetical protein
MFAMADNMCFLTTVVVDELSACGWKLGNGEIAERFAFDNFWKRQADINVALEVESNRGFLALDSNIDSHRRSRYKACAQVLNNDLHWVGAKSRSAIIFSYRIFEDETRRVYGGT